MNIAITGSTGYIGKHLSSFLMADRGDQVIPIGRDLLDKDKQKQLAKVLSYCDVVVNFAGVPIGRRWTSRHKKEMYESRITTTARLVEAMKLLDIPPKLFISASAVGFYPSDDGEKMETSVTAFNEWNDKYGDGFLSSLCSDWEQEAKQCPSSVRLVIVRLGIVLSTDGGILYRILKFVRRFKTLVMIPSGTQPFPWVSIRDLCRAIDFFICNSSLHGVFNLVTPSNLTYNDFACSILKIYKPWWKIKIPYWILALRYGKAMSFFTTGQRVWPMRLLESGFTFSIPTIASVVKPADHTMSGGLDINSYMGLWYEIARFDHRFERGLSDVTAIYSLRRDGKIVVENRGCRQRGTDKIYQSIKGIATLSDASSPRRLRVSFFLGFYSDYRILELDEKEYSYALIGSNTDDYLWILSRTPQLTEENKKLILEAAKRRGYDTTRLLWVEHT